MITLAALFTIFALLTLGLALALFGAALALVGVLKDALYWAKRLLE